MRGIDQPGVAIEPGKSEQAPPQSHGRLWRWGILLLILLVMAGIRFRLRDMPLERDEGEYAYAGQLMLQGIPPYQLAYNMKFPGTYAAYAAIMGLFGQSPAGIHLGFILVNVMNILMIYLLTKRLAEARAGLMAAALYAYLSLSQGVLGTSAHATHFVLLAAIPGLLLLLRGLERGSGVKLFMGGVLLGIAVLMKQHGAVFVVFAGAYLVYVFWTRGELRAWKRLAGQGSALAVGVLLPLTITGLWLWKAGVFGRFWFWTIQYGRHYATEHPSGIEVLKNLLHGMPAALYPALYVAFCGLVVLARRRRADAVFAAGLLGCSFAAVFPNFNFRPHYFVLMLPAVSLLAGVAVSAACEFMESRSLSRVQGEQGSKTAAANSGSTRTPNGGGKETRRPGQATAGVMALFVLALAGAAYLEREVFFQLTPEAACRWLYARSAFPESVTIGRYLKDHTTENARIAVLGSEPQLYFYAQRHSATGYIYTYALMEPQPYAARMQNEMIHEIESGTPQYVVLVQDMDSWVVRTNSNQMILDWCGPYLRAQYEKVGLAENFLDGRREMRWGEEAKNRTPAADVYVAVYRRKSSEMINPRSRDSR